MPLAMSVGVETNRRRKTYDMAFRAIGDLAVEVLRNAKAARGHDGAHNFSGPTHGVDVGPMQSVMDGTGMGDAPTREDQSKISAPMLEKQGGTASSNGTNKRAGARRTPASCAVREVNSRSHRAGRNPVKLVLVSSNCEPRRKGVPHACAFAQRGLGSHLMLVSGHAAIR